MSNKLRAGLLIVCAVCLFICGFVFKEGAEISRGTEIKSGVMIDGKFQETESGTIGGDKDAVNMFMVGERFCYVIGAVIGVSSIVVLFSKK